MCVLVMFFFSSRRRHTICALVTGVQTCALPISARSREPAVPVWPKGGQRVCNPFHGSVRHPCERLRLLALVSRRGSAFVCPVGEIGRASCRESVCQYV